jgi:penicillin-binding protein 1A
VGGVVAYAAYKRFSADLPDIATLQNYQPRVMSRVYASDDRLLAELATERRIFVPFAAIPDLVKHAFISAEDQNFYSHRGVDPVAILRAGVTDLMQYGQGRRPVGASSITQQVAKNMLLGNEVSLSRKAREALLAIRIEDGMSKEHILELYLNEIYLGLQAYGVAAAAQSYFNKSLDQLTIPEAAFLAALPKAPNNYNPFRYPEAARARRDYVIDRMAQDGVITAEEATAAKSEPVKPSAFRRAETLAGGEYFTEEVRRWMVDKYGADETTQGGMVVHTTLDPTLQLAADHALRDGLMRYDLAHGGWRGPVGHVALGADARTTWPATLAAQPHPPGELAEWRTGLVLETTDSTAQIGFVAAQPRVMPVSLSDLGWARPNKAGQLGPAPKRMTDVLQAGDVVMVELLPATVAQGKTAARPERLVLRQIPAVQGALVSLDPATGRVLALSGGWSFENSQFDRVIQAQRQPGSSFKPFVYLTALEAGISPSQKFLDAPFVVDLGAAGKWRPGNYELDFNGPVPLRVALEKSLNLVTVRVADKVGMEAVAKNAIAFHVVDNMPRVLPGALGAVDTTVMRQSGAYASLATGGREVIPTLVDSVQDRDGHVIWRSEVRPCSGCDDPAHTPSLTDPRTQIADPASVFQLLGMMQGVVQRGTGTAAAVGLNRQIAGKTGTSQDFNDAWFAGFTPDLVTVVWVGYDTPASLGNNETGGAISAPIWHDFMAVALKNRPNLKFIQPPGVTMASWDSGSGTVTDAFKPGQEPGASAPLGGSMDTAGTDPAAPGAAPRAQAAAGVDTGLGGLY